MEKVDWDSIIAKVKNNDQQVFVELLNKSQNIIDYAIRHTLNYIQEEDFEDIKQEISLKLYKKLTLFDPQKSQYPTWLSVMCKNHCTDWIKEKNNETKTWNDKKAIELPIFSLQKENFDNSKENNETTGLQKTYSQFHLKKSKEDENKKELEKKYETITNDVNPQSADILGKSIVDDLSFSEILQQTGLKKSKYYERIDEAKAEFMFQDALEEVKSNDFTQALIKFSSLVNSLQKFRPSKAIKYTMAKCYNEMVRIQADNFFNVNEALRYNQLAVSLWEELKDFDRIIERMCLFAGCYAKFEQYDKSLHLLDDIDDFLLRNKTKISLPYKIHKAGIEYTRGSYITTLGNLEAGENCIKNAIRIYEELNIDPGRKVNTISLTKIKIRQKKFSTAENLIFQTTQGLPDVLTLISHKMAICEFYLATKNLIYASESIKEIERMCHNYKFPHQLFTLKGMLAKYQFQDYYLSMM